MRGICDHWGRYRICASEFAAASRLNITSCLRYRACPDSHEPRVLAQCPLLRDRQRDVVAQVGRFDAFGATASPRAKASAARRATSAACGNAVASTAMKRDASRCASTPRPRRNPCRRRSIRFHRPATRPRPARSRFRRSARPDRRRIAGRMPPNTPRPCAHRSRPGCARPHPTLSRRREREHGGAHRQCRQRRHRHHRPVQCQRDALRHRDGQSHAGECTRAATDRDRIELRPGDACLGQQLLRPRQRQLGMAARRQLEAFAHVAVDLHGDGQASVAVSKASRFMVGAEWEREWKGSTRRTGLRPV